MLFFLVNRRVSHLATGFNSGAGMRIDLLFEACAYIDCWLRLVVPFWTYDLTENHKHLGLIVGEKCC